VAASFVPLYRLFSRQNADNTISSPPPHIRTVRHLDIIKVLFIHQLMHQSVVLKTILKFTFKQIALTCFGVTVTPSSGGALIVLTKVTVVKIAN